MRKDKELNLAKALLDKVVAGMIQGGKNENISMGCECI